MEHSEKVFGSNDSQLSTILPFHNQNYEQLKADCLRNRILFEDPVFPATDRSIAYSRQPESNIWKRPFEIVRAPAFTKDGAAPGDLDQGSLGDCWFISSCAAMCMKANIFPRVVPLNQEMTGPNYAGIFHFRFWLYGQWYDVVIDDRLPVTPDGRLVFCSNVDQPQEFWPALLEKAYAKACLSYQNLDMGFMANALVDLTGGIDESFELKQLTNPQRNGLWEIITKSTNYDTLMCAGINGDPNVREARLANGLVMGHAYTIERVEVIKVGGQYVKLIRIRNPWGNSYEWTGRWSDKSTDWSMIPEETRNFLGYKRLPDGEYWMSFDDFCNNFDILTFCSLVPDAYPSELVNPQRKTKLTWKSTSYHARWVPNQSSGGSANDPRAYWTNPQFLITLNDVDTNDHDNNATVIISLMQKNAMERRMAKNGEFGEEAIGFALYRVINPTDANRVKQSGMRLYANQLQLVGGSGDYTYMRNVTQRFSVPIGDYVIIPSCFYQNIDLEFLLRVYTEEEIKPANFKVLNKHKTTPLEEIDIHHSKFVTGAFEDLKVNPFHRKENSLILKKDRKHNDFAKPKHFLKMACGVFSCH